MPFFIDINLYTNSIEPLCTAESADWKPATSEDGTESCLLSKHIILPLGENSIQHFENVDVTSKASGEVSILAYYGDLDYTAGLSFEIPKIGNEFYFAALPYRLTLQGGSHADGVWSVVGSVVIGH